MSAYAHQIIIRSTRCEQLHRSGFSFASCHGLRRSRKSPTANIALPTEIIQPGFGIQKGKTLGPGALHLRSWYRWLRTKEH